MKSDTRAWRRCSALLAALAVGFAASPADAAGPAACGNRVYDKEAAFSFNLTRLRAGEKDGHRFVQYQLHMQANLANAANIAYTWLRAVGISPAGKVAAGYDDSRLKVTRVVHKPFYAHFRITVKPGSVLSYKGYMHLTVPIKVPGGQLTGWHYSGSCAAR
jgi:hypothetical protein